MDRLIALGPYARWLPLGLIAVAIVADVLVPGTYTGVPLITSACVLAGSTLSFRGTVGIGVLAFCVTLVLNSEPGFLRIAPDWKEELNVVLATVIGLDVNRLLDRSTRRLARARSVSGTMQRAILPTPPPRIGPLEVATRYEAADAEARIGGDAYAIQSTPYGVRVLIGDVRGKGVGAISTASTLIGAFREAAHYVPGIEDLAERLERSLERDAAERHPGEDDDEFVTALIAEIDEAGTTLRVVNRGHPAPYLIRDGRVTELATTAPDLPLGMGALADRRSCADTVPLSPGDVLLFVTDGVTEARDPGGAFYDPASLAADGAGLTSAAAVLDELTDAIHRWTGGPRDDDMATLAVAVTETGRPD
jgi:serine phosphatase RsbU (regulator of sigma subunit)